MAFKMLQRRGSASQWTLSNPVLGDGEIGFERDSYKFKIGDGIQDWNSLDYFSSDAGDTLGLVTVDTLVWNVKDHGVVGDGVADDRATIQAVLDSLPEGAIAYFPYGTYLISSPLVLRRNRSMQGTFAGLWPYDTGGPCRIRATASFAGSALIQFKDEENLYGSVGAPASGLYVGPNDQSGMSISRITFDGFNVAGPVDGILASGLVRSVRLTEVTVRRCSGSGIHTVGYARTGGTTVYPRGWRMDKVVTEACGNMGFATNLLNDSTLTDCLAVGNTTHGFYLGGPGELVMIGCRAAFNKGRGYYFTGTCYGNVVMSACTTDRSEQSGVFIDTTGKHPIVISGCAFRRDGRNANGGGGNYAGLLVSGATNPIVVDGITTETGQDDDATGVMSPQFGMRALNTTSLVVSSGVLHGSQAGYLDGGGNLNVRISPLVLLVSGSINSPTTTYVPDSAPFPQPVDHGLIAWSYDVAEAVNTATNAVSSGVLSLIKIRTTVPRTISSLVIYISTAGAGLTAGQCFGGLYNAAGTLIATTADQATAWVSTGTKTMTLTAVSGQSLTLLPPGNYYIALLAVGTTMPTLIRASGQPALNIGLTAGAYRYCTYGSGLTALPTTLTMASQISGSIATWAAVA